MTLSIHKRSRYFVRSGWLIGNILFAMVLAFNVTIKEARAQETLKVGIPYFLSGAAAGPFGIPARNGAEVIIDAINKGKMPAPYNTKGIGGAQVEGIYIDESGGTTKQVAEFRNLVQRQNVDAVVGYISSGSCVAIAPVADELKMLTLFSICGTPRIFEDGNYKYVFRPLSHSTIDNVGAAHYVKSRFPNASQIGAINPNYAWGQDSWRDFHLAMESIDSSTKITTEQFPKLFAGQFSSEISALLLSKSDAIHSALWGGDMESFIFQLAARGLHKKSKIILTTGEGSMYRLGAKMPDGIIIGARGPYGILAADTELNRWFRKAYFDAYSLPPVYPAYMAAQGMLALKIAYDKAAQAKGSMPTREEAAKALEYLEFEAFGTHVKMSMGNGHQGVTETAYGMYKFDKSTGTPQIVDVVRFSAECVNPPEGVKSVDWIKGGMKGAKCN